MPFRLKRAASPRTWPVPRKGTKWVQRPSPGPHPQEECLPVLLVLRDLLKVVRSQREARLLLREGKVRVDGKVVKDPARGLGLMDVLSLGSSPGQDYRVLKDKRGKLRLLPIPHAEASFKLGRVRGKHTVPGGQVSLALHDGRNVLVAPNTEFRVGDTVRLELPGQRVLERLPLAAQALAYIAGGSHVGELARVERVEVLTSSQANRIHFKEGFFTIKDYVFVVGQERPQVTLPEGLGP